MNSPTIRDILTKPEMFTHLLDENIFVKFIPACEIYDKLYLLRVLADNKIFIDINNVLLYRFLDNLLYNNPLEQAILYLENYKEHLINIPFQLNGIEIVETSFPINYKNDSKMVAVYVASIINNCDDNYLKAFLDKMEYINSREFVVDSLLLLDRDFINLYDDGNNNLEYIDNFVILTYIGNQQNIQDKFNRWLAMYIDSNYESDCELEDIIKDYIVEVAKYMSYLPKAIEVYKELKSLKLKEKDTYDIETIKQIISKLI